MKYMEIDEVILGGGITGLSYAYFKKNQKANKSFVILEKENKVGGYCKTNKVNGFIWDYAGHFFHFKNQEIKNMFLNEINYDELIFQKKNTKIFYKNGLLDYPFQKNIHQLEKDEFIECLYELFKKEEKDKYLDFEEMLYGKFGKGITNKFLKPYNEKLYACSLKELDVNSMGRFFPYANKEEIISNMKFQDNKSYNDEFLYPKKGANVFINALLKNLPQESILCNEEVKKINITLKEIETTNYKIKFKKLINTIPLPEFLKKENKEMYEKNKKLFSTNKVIVFNIGINKENIYDGIHWIYFPEKKYNFYRIGFYNNILKENRVSIYVEIGYPSEKDINLEKEYIKTIENLKEIGIIEKISDIDCHESIIMNPAYVHINENVNNFKKIYKEKLAEKNIYTIGRYGDWKYCSIEDCILDSLSLVLKSLVIKEN